MDHYAGMLASGSLLGNPLDGSSVEMGSSNNVVLYRDDEDECLEKDDDDNICDGDETHTQQQQQEQQQQLVVSHIEEGFYIDDAHNGVEGPLLKRKRRRGPRLWKDTWQKLHPWAFIRNLNGEERMFCTVCEVHGHTTTRNTFRKEGSTNFQQSALATHANSSAHRSALSIQKSRAEAGICCQDARRINASCALNDPLMPVPTADGTYPDNLPASLAELVKLSNDHVDSLLMIYGLPTHGQLDAKVRRLKAHLGFQ